MSIYDGRYFILNKTLLRVLGLWAYDDWKKYVVMTFAVVLISIISSPNAIGLYVNFSDADRMMQHLMYTLYMIAVIFKIVTFGMSLGEVKIMLDAITENYALIVDVEEKEIMRKFAERAREITVGYIILLIICASGFVLLPLYPIILDKFDPLDVPRERRLCMDGEYLVKDRNAYFWQIYLCETLTVFSVLTTGIAVDGTYVSCIHHCLGLFAIIKYRLQKPDQLMYDVESGVDNGNRAMKDIIQLHQKVLEFAGLLDDSYSTCFLALMFTHVIGLPANSVCVLIYINRPLHLIRYVVSFIGLTAHQLMLNWPAQFITDASTDLYVDAYCNEWYTSSSKTKKLLLIFLLRCRRPAIISAGGLMDMGLENFYRLTSKAISYIAVLSSFR